MLPYLGPRDDVPVSEVRQDVTAQVRMWHRRGPVGTLYLGVNGRTIYLPGGWSSSRYEKLLATTDARPGEVFVWQGQRYWRYRDRWYATSSELSPDDVAALLAADDERTKAAIREAYLLQEQARDPRNIAD